jgi:hypothetical protein
MGGRGFGTCRVVLTHNHAEPNLLSAVLLLDCLVQHNVQEDLCLLALWPSGSSSVCWAFFSHRIRGARR